MRMRRLIGLGVALLVLAVSDGVAHAGARSSRVCDESVATPVPQPTRAQMAAAGLAKLPVAPEDRRVDLVAPPFSNPTEITNPLFPISRLASVVLNGRVEGKAFRTETTLLPDTRIIEWSPGQCVKTLVSQYVAYLDGRIEEVALDRYAQADDGSVWYLGEDVFNYKRGVVADTEGTWLAGKEGPAAMIMSAEPRVGFANRAENIPGLVWEEVTTKRIRRTVRGPRGPVAGAMVASELHDDGTFSDKVFAPGYGEFYSASKGEVEALALAVPTDALPGGTPPALATILRGAKHVFSRPASRSTRRTVRGIEAAWEAHRRVGVPFRLVTPTRRALTALARAALKRNLPRTRHAALDVVQAALDLELRYRSPVAIDRARFDLWARRVGVDAAARKRAAVSGDIATLEWIRDRIARSLRDVALTRLDAQLVALRAQAADGKLAAAARTARSLRKLLARAGRR